MSIVIKKIQHVVRALGLWLFLLPLATANAQLKPTEDAIIYEYEVITQKKGEPFSAFLDGSILSAQEKALITAIPIMHAAESERHFHLSYLLRNGSRSLKEVKIIQGKRIINFVLVDEGGKQTFVKKATQIPIILQSTIANDAKRRNAAKSIGGQLHAVSFVQKKGQSLKKAWTAAQLSSLQKRIVEGGSFVKSAKSDRTFTLYFEKQGNKRLLKGLRLRRNQSLVEYQLQKLGGRFKLVDLGTLDKTKRTAVQEWFNRAKGNSNASDSAATQSLSATKQSAVPELVSVSEREAKASKPAQTSSSNNAQKKYFGLRVLQNKGQSIQQALQPAMLSALQQRIVLSGDFVKAAKSQRSISLFFEKAGSKRLLKGLRLIRKKIQLDYEVKKVKGQFVLVNLKTVPAAERKKLKALFSNIHIIALKPSSKKAVAVDAGGAKHRYLAKQLTQRKGQSLNSALAAAKLSRLQQQIVKSGDFLKKAKSTRQFTLYYEKSGKKLLLKGLRVQRNKSIIDYSVKKSGGKFRLVNAKKLPKSEASELKKRFQLAKIQYLTAQAKKQAPSKQSSSKQSPARKQARSTATLVTERKQGNFISIGVRQRKGQTLYSAIKNANLSVAQRKLIFGMPASSAAKSDRIIYLLLEKKGRRKYLRALRVVRGRRSAEYVVAKHKGKLVWANSKGQIDSASSFSRYPLKFSRISSGFNLRRRHPITRRIRPHKGVDLKAPHGAPIYAPANGVVKFSGRQRGYGIVLEIDHQNGYRTKYAHLSRIMRNARQGKYVKKGQLIAKVGNTGISTGAHLHYEILVNGVPRNPCTVRLPRGGGKKAVAAAKTAAVKYLPILRRLSR